MANTKSTSFDLGRKHLIEKFAKQITAGDKIEKVANWEWLNQLGNKLQSGYNQLPQGTIPTALGAMGGAGLTHMAMPEGSSTFDDLLMSGLGGMAGAGMGMAGNQIYQHPQQFRDSLHRGYENFRNMFSQNSDPQHLVQDPNSYMHGIINRGLKGMSQAQTILQPLAGHAANGYNNMRSFLNGQ